MLSLQSLSKTYPNGVHALERFSADIGHGEIVAIIGGSGCGKSTLLRAIAGLDPASSGSVDLDGARITAPHERIGIIFTEGAGFAYKSNIVPQAIAVLTGIRMVQVALSKKQDDIISCAITGLARRMHCDVQKRWQAEGGPALPCATLV